MMLMQEVLAGLDDFAPAYFDDIVIFSETENDHLKHIQTTFDRLRQHKLKLKLKKVTTARMRNCPSRTTLSSPWTIWSTRNFLHESSFTTRSNKKSLERRTMPNASPSGIRG